MIIIYTYIRDITRIDGVGEGISARNVYSFDDRIYIITECICTHYPRMLQLYLRQQTFYHNYTLIES